MKATEILEAVLSIKDLNKRDNWNVLKKRIQSGKPFKLNSDKSDIVIDPQEELIQALTVKDFSGTPYISGKSIRLPIKGGGSVPLRGLYKDKEFGGIEGGKDQTERQESGLVQAINGAVEQNGGPITLVTEDANMKKVSKAYKVSGVNAYGKEPYADIIIESSGKKLLVSAKGSSAPSIAGGGLAGLHNLNPSIIKDALDNAEAFYKKNYSHLEGKTSPPPPEVYSKIDHKYLDDIIRGNKKMGGPIDYMYIGPMEVTSVFNNGILKISGKLTPVDEYIDSVDDLFLRIRRRTTEQVLTFDKKDKQGYPSIFFAPGEGHRRVVVYPKKSVPKNAVPYSDDIYVKKA